MPGYKAIIMGEDFVFEVEDQLQSLDFYRTLYLDANDEQTASALALQRVHQELAAQSLLDDASAADDRIRVEQILLLDEATAADQEGDYLWCLAEDDLDD